MRRIEREALSDETAGALRQLQQQADLNREQEGFDPGEHWNRNRRTASILAVHAVLLRMAGVRERCMYCVDSHASDIRHFWPKASFSESIYAWDNLLGACTQCGRYKGSQFPRTEEGMPLLTDPSAEDPWEFLDFSPDTGNLTARFLLDAGRFSPKGETTVRVLHLDEREGVAAGYTKTYRRLRHLVAEWANGILPQGYVEQLRETDDHGLLGWFLHGNGASEPSFLRFRGRHPEAWIECQLAFR